MPIWRSQWKGDIIYSHGTTSKAGVAIMFDHKFKYTIQKSTIDDNGRFLIVDIIVNDEVYTLINIYAPNDDDPNYFQNIFVKQLEHANTNIIIGGDFNLVFDIELDCANPNRRNNVKSLHVIKEYVNQLMLTDVWRYKYPTEKKYTWIGRALSSQSQNSRIDYILVNYGIISQCEASILPGYATDHSLLQVCFQLNTPPRGKGIWRLNTSHLQDPKFLSYMNETIDQARFNLSCQLPDEAWEIVKEKSILAAQSWSKRKAKDNKSELRNIINKLELYEANLSKCNHLQQKKSYDKNIQMLKIRQDISRITKGSMVRSRYKWYTEAETGSSYFLNLEKVKYSNKTIKMLIQDDGTILRDHKKILKV